MIKYLIGIVALFSGAFNNEANIGNAVPLLNTAIISYQSTFYAPAMADPGNFPWANKFVTSDKPKTKPADPERATVATPPSAPAIAPVPTVVAPPAEPEDPYLAKREPVTPWLLMDFSYVGRGVDGTRDIPEIKIDREYWKMEVYAYWATDITPPKPPVLNNYFKIEVYESGSNKLITTIASGKDEVAHRTQSFKKPGKYYFKISNDVQSYYEIKFFVSPKIAQ